MILFSRSWKSQSLTGSSTQLFSRYWSSGDSVKSPLLATVCLSMSEMRQSPVAVLYVADLQVQVMMLECAYQYQ